ncbi:prepilin signal peptidase PulO-like peptidase [Spongiibacter sp. IMCC21906]|uniref:prepilin peptidase n=1 Tax=Spongiibacter sp. IMCC21906 TaxID=1620392 RepID=UPI00062DF984|nr:A24 family peptidase [Spongiibacter sp. IMCC21906]AKH68908.1 prepilin signal peptidase PulO-like peptidase [Spongiibacter sp. IMCC21906]
MSILQLADSHPLLLITIIGGFGLLFGSFFNVVIYRLPKIMERNWHQECRLLLELPEQAETPFGLSLPHSHCPKCNAAVKAWQNIPVVSFLLLRGRCASCKTSIGLRYPAIEIATSALAVFSLLHFGLSPQGFAVVIFSWILLILTMIDIDHQLLPDQLTLPLLWLGLLFHSITGLLPLSDVVWGAIAGYLSLWSVFWLFKLLTGKEGMGYGDFKLLAALGAWLGWQMLPLVIILSSVVGAVLGVISLSLAGKSKSQPIPFGPYLAIAGWVAMFWGQEILDQYLQFAGLG